MKELIREIKSQKQGLINFKVQQQGACVIIVFNLHLLKSGIVKDPELIFPKTKQKITLPACSAVFYLLMSDYREASRAIQSKAD